MHEIGGDAALFVNIHNVQELKKAFLNVINDSDLYRGLVERGRCNATRFSLSEIVEQYY